MDSEKSYWERFWADRLGRRVSRRRLLRNSAFGAAGIAGVLAVGCGDDDDDGGTSATPGAGSQTAAATATATAGPVVGGSIATTSRYTFSSFDPHQIRTSPLRLWGAAGNRLLQVVPSEDAGSLFTLESDLATGMPESPSPDQFIFTIRDDATWHDGTVVTAADVKFSLEHMQTSPSSPLSNVMKFVDSIDVSGNQVTLSLSEPFIGLIPYLGSERSSIIPEHIYSKEGAFESAVVGSGPFMFENPQDLSVDSTSFTVVKNPNYWKQGLPYLDSMEMSIVTDDAIILASFLAEQIDIYMHGVETNKALIDQIPDSLDPIIYKNPNYQQVCYLINHNRPPFNDPRVRKAVNLAVDRQQLDVSWAGGEGTFNGPIPAYMSDYALSQDFLSSAPGYRTPKNDDIAEARQLLEAAGQTGAEFEVLSYQPSTAGETYATVMEQFMDAIGLKANINITESAVARERRGNGDFDIAVRGQASEFDPEGYLLEYLPGNFGNDSQIDDAELTSKIIAQRSLTDVDERKAAIEEIQKYLLDMNYRIYTVDGFNYGAAQAYVRDYWQLTLGVATMEGVSKDEA